MGIWLMPKGALLTWPLDLMLSNRVPLVKSIPEEVLAMFFRPLHTSSKVRLSSSKLSTFWRRTASRLLRIRAIKCRSQSPKPKKKLCDSSSRPSLKTSQPTCYTS